MFKKQMDEKAECIKHGACMQSKNGVLEGPACGRRELESMAGVVERLFDLQMLG